MNRRACFAALILLTLSGTSYAGPVLLASYEAQELNGLAPNDDPRLEFVLQLIPNGSVVGRAGLGFEGGFFWSDGEQGFVDFNAANDPAFDEFEVLATNGLEDRFSAWSTWPNGGGGGGDLPEFFLFRGRMPDLFGFDLEFVRLIVNDISIEPWMPQPGEEGFIATYDIRYEFYGTPIPEPGSALLLLGGVVAFTARWRGGTAESTNLPFGGLY